MSAPDIFTPRWLTPCVEPVQRKVAGRFGFASHRFPIKGGITPREAQIQTVRGAVSRAICFSRTAKRIKS